MLNETKTEINRNILQNRFNEVREFSEYLCEPLTTEDYVIQSMPDVSPAKWHLAHTAWFFEAFILKEFIKNYKPLHNQYSYLFNSYYIGMGERFTRSQRGLLTRPTVKEVYEYRKYVNEAMNDFICNSAEEILLKCLPLIEVGFNHEQQHQELILTDIKHVLYQNPLKIIYRKKEDKQQQTIPPLEWIHFKEGIYEIGHNGKEFAYDNEKPGHQVYLNSFLASSRLITCGEYLEFINDDGYRRPELWLSDGAAAVEKEKWIAPLYWEKENDEWFIYKLIGHNKINPNEPVTHISYYEADAFAAWKESRLLTEFEWEVVSAGLPLHGNFVENKNFNPAPADKNEKTKILQLFGDTWEWTGSSYLPYPGFKKPPGALGEYNGKFMSGQMVLRGGSCATHSSHIRNTYRNFFPPSARWQFSGIRLAKDNNE